MSQSGESDRESPTGSATNGASRIVANNPAGDQTFGSVGAALEFGRSYIAENFSGKMNYHEFHIWVYSNGGKITVSSIAMGPSNLNPDGTLGRGTVSPLCSLASVPKGSTLLADLHTHQSKTPSSAVSGRMDPLNASNADARGIQYLRQAASGSISKGSYSGYGINSNIYGYIWQQKAPGLIRYYHPDRSPQWVQFGRE